MAAPAITALLGAHAAASGAWTPASLSGLVAWYDASNSGSIHDTSGSVDQWDDLSGNGNHQTASGTARPTTGASTINSLNVLTFDGGTDTMSCALASNITGANHTAAGVIVMDGSVNYAEWISVYQTGSADWNSATSWVPAARDTASSTDLRTYSNGSRRGVITTSGLSSVHVVIAISDGTNGQIYVDGTGGTAESWTTPSLNADILRIGAGNEGGVVNRWPGRIAEVVYCTAALGTTDRNALEAYLKAKWGTP